jgi:PST family polysaccharide transporter
MTSSHRQILKSSAIIGSASVIGILLGIVRLRIAATAVGPVGIGIIGLLQNFVMLAGSLAAMGIGNGAARQIAAALGRDDASGLAAAKRTLLIGGVLLALVGGAVAWLVSAFGSAEVLSSEVLAKDAPLLGLAAALSVVAAVQLGLLTGARRLGDIARVNIIAGLLTTLVVALAFPLWPSRAVIVFVVATPLLSVRRDVQLRPTPHDARDRLGHDGQRRPGARQRAGRAGNGPGTPRR